jgi:hypothetical protein
MVDGGWWMEGGLLALVTHLDIGGSRPDEPIMATATR